MLWDGVGRRRRLRLDPMEVPYFSEHRREPQNLGKLSIFHPSSGLGIAKYFTKVRVSLCGSGQGTHIPLTSAYPLHLSPLWLLGTGCVMNPEKKQELYPYYVSLQISKTGKEIKDFVEAQAVNDPLLKGIPEDKNPFKEKGACVIN